MNNLYFACSDCKIYLDAGYRWAYWELEEPCIVERGEQVDVAAVLDAECYWNPPQEENSEWLYQEIFPVLKHFLNEHRLHKVIFGESEDFAPVESDSYFDWLQIGFLAGLTPRYFIEVLKLQNWGQVIDYVKQQQNKPWWWEYAYDDEQTHHQVKEKFLELVRKQNHG